MIKLKISILVLMLAMVSVLPAIAQEEEAAQQPAPIQPYEGEITDEMIVSFIEADTKMRQLRNEINVRTQQILEESGVKPEVYIAIVQKVREDQTFLEKIRAKAAEMVAPQE